MKYAEASHSFEAALAVGDERARGWATAYLVLYPRGRFRLDAESALAAPPAR